MKEILMPEQAYDIDTLDKYIVRFFYQTGMMILY